MFMLLLNQTFRGILIIVLHFYTWGISAKSEEDGGAHLIVVYNSGRFRMAGRGSLAGLLPFADANGIVVEMASEVLPVVGYSCCPLAYSILSCLFLKQLPC